MVETKNKVSSAGDCPSCGNGSTIRDHKLSSEICKNCGRIIKQNIKDKGPEWREYNQEEKEERNRGGAPITLTIHDKGLSTQISYKNRDGKGNKLSPNRRTQMYRLRKRQKSAKLSEQKDRNLTAAFTEIDRMSSQLGLPREIQEITAKIYRSATDNDLIRGHSIERMSAASLYVACRKTRIPRTLKEIAKVSYTNKKELGKSYRYLSRELDIQLPPTDPSMYVARFGSELEMSGEVRTKAISIIKKAQENKLTVGKSPAGISAAALYIASIQEDEKRYQSKIAEAANVTEVTLRSRYKEMKDELDIEVNP